MNGKPRSKDETELAWSQIKRAVTAEVNYKMQCQREIELNQRLNEAWDTFTAALSEDKRLGAGALELRAELSA